MTSNVRQGPRGEVRAARNLQRSGTMIMCAGRKTEMKSGSSNINQYRSTHQKEKKKKLN